jgi:hypothetical protein
MGFIVSSLIESIFKFINVRNIEILWLTGNMSQLEI